MMDHIHGLSMLPFLDVKAAIVNLPPSFAKQGIFSWSTLGHETAGHDIIHAYSGLRRE